MHHPKRFHDLDALRAFAMLLGIVLHAVIAYMPMPVWPVQDVRQHGAYAYVLHAVHGFRMPLFFLVSGYFTAMLWRGRGLRALIVHRARRILLPLVAFGIVLVPLQFGLMWAGFTKQKQITETRGEEFRNPMEGTDETKFIDDYFKTRPVAGVLLFLLVIFPLFHHLWFLYYLLWLVAGFGLLAWMARRFGWRRWGDAVVASPWRWAWLVPPTLLFQLMMPTSFGADTAAGILPWPPILLYYAIFFAYGALAHGHDAFLTRVGRSWGWCLAAAVPVGVAGLVAFDARTALFKAGFEENAREILLHHLAVSACAAVYAWLMIFGLIGLFRRLFAVEHPRIRYVSDSAYWLYLMHLPLILFLQIVSMDWEAPHVVKLAATCAITVGALLAVYHVAVRYTWLGTMLNGPRTRPGKRAV